MTHIDAKLHKMTFTDLFRRKCHLLPLYSHFAWISLYNTSFFQFADCRGYELLHVICKNLSEGIILLS